MSDLSGNYGRQPTVLDSGLPYPKPIEEEYISGEESKKEELELKKEKLKKESGYKREEQPKRRRRKKRRKRAGMKRMWRWKMTATSAVPPSKAGLTPL